VIRQSSVDAFAAAALSPDPDLATAALMIAGIEYADLDAAWYLSQLDAIGREARRRLAEAPSSHLDAPEGADVGSYARVMALNDYLFRDLGFAGNDAFYDDPRNSCLNEVLDRRTGIPITLAVVYMETARRAGLLVEGVNFPGHFLVRCPAPRARTQAHAASRDLLIDAHHGGAIHTEDACRQMHRRRLRRQDDGGDDRDPVIDARLFARAAKPQILGRMLLNLKRLYVAMRSFPQARDATELLLAIDPSAAHELRDRGLIAFQLKDFSSALRDLERYLQLSAGQVSGEDEREEQAQIWEHVKTLRKRIAAIN
jgi:regulator of sirC expression with transglutaminase-like and TPR domain